MFEKYREPDSIKDKMKFFAFLSREVRPLNRKNDEVVSKDFKKIGIA